MKHITTLLALLTLAACGADGAPSAAAPASAPATGVSISGDARMGVVVNPSMVESQ